MTTEPLAVVEAYLAAQAARDFDAVRALLADEGFIYMSPIARFVSADEFVQYSALSGGIIVDREVHQVVIEGADVCHILSYRIQISEKIAVRVAHWARVQAGRIQRIETFFDASVYRDLFPLEDAGPR